MGKKNAITSEKKRQQRAMKKRQKDKSRSKDHSSTAMSENAVQHQMLSNFGNVKNFVKNIQGLSDMFKTDEDLAKIRLDPEKVYEKIDLQADREALIDIYSDDDFTSYDEQFEDFWKAKRKDILEDIVDDDLVNKTKSAFQKLLVTQKGHKKEYRAVMAGKLLLDSHIYSLTEAPVQENALWEILFNAAIKENKKDLPEPAEPEPEVEAAEAEPQVETPDVPESKPEPEADPES